MEEACAIIIRLVDVEGSQDIGGNTGDKYVRV